MRKTKNLLILQTVLLFLLVSGANAEMSSTSFQITTSVLSGGGNMMSSVNFNMLTTLGQPTALGSGSSSSYSIEPGFLNTLLLTITVGDVNGNGVVNLEDVIMALQAVTQQTVGSIHLEADTNGDGKIGLAEAIMVLRKLGN